MQLNLRTDYAVRILLYLVMSEDIVTSARVSDAMSIPPQYTSKLMRSLEKAGFLSSSPGPKGGYRLNKNPDAITLFDIVSVTEPTIKLNRCLEEDRFCSRDAANVCKVHFFYSFLQQELEEKLSQVTIQSLLEMERNLCS